MNAVPKLSLQFPEPKGSGQALESVKRAMTRFPLLVKILGELYEVPIPLPGDDDIRHGCERALTSILSELARIESAPSGKRDKSYETTMAWLQDPAARQLIDADKLQRMEVFINCILNPADH